MKRAILTRRVLASVTALALTMSLCACQNAPAASSAVSGAAAAVQDGVYTAQANGFSLTGPLHVEVTITDGRIADITLGENSETANVGGLAAQLLIPRIIENQSVAVDSITGATVTSAAIKAAVSDCYQQAGGSVSDIQTKPAESTATESYDVDVAVVGFGGSGAAAALAAAQNGASVMVLEKAGRIGGTSSVTGGMMSVNPESQVERDIPDWTDPVTGETVDKPAGQELVDADALYEDWTAYTTVDGVQDAKESLIRTTIDESGDTMDWLTENGFSFDDAVTFLGGQWAVYTTYTGDKALTQGFFDKLLGIYEEAGGQYLLETEATELLFTDGKVSGVRAVKADGTQVTVNAQKVILACGGFAGSKDLMEEYLGEDWKGYGMLQNDGAGIEMALSAGGSTYNIDMPPMSHFSAPQTIMNQFDNAFDNDILYGMVNSSETLAVNKDGARFVNEQNIGYGAYVGGSRFYSLYTSDMIDTMREQGFGKDATGRYMNHVGVGGGIPADTPMTNIDAVLEAGIQAKTVYKAATLSELAEQIAADNPRMTEQALLDSVAAYNEGIASGTDAMGKDASCFERLGAIEDGCDYYIAVVGAPYIYSTCGGINVDDAMHVLDENGAVVENLYSVGTDSMGVLFTNDKGYANYGGVAQAWCFVSGRIAGEDAAASLA